MQGVIDLDPNFPRAHEYLGLGYLTQGRYSEAIVELQKAVELSGRDRRPLRDLGYGYAASGKRAEALTVLKEFEGNYEKHKAIGTRLGWSVRRPGREGSSLCLAGKGFSGSQRVVGLEQMDTALRFRPQRPAIRRPAAEDGAYAMSRIGQIRR
jgi:tetratricopeptide (TPR) repeat protein